MEPNSSQALEARRILLVDDDRVVLMMMTSVLEQLGHRVETASNGAEAYALLRERPDDVDVVLADRMMPIMDGLALTRRLKREPSTRLIPVILLTGASAPSDQAEGMAAGAFYYLPKPVDPVLLDQIVRSAAYEHSTQKLTRATLKSHQVAFANLQVAKFTLQRPAEVEGVASLLASMAPNPERAFQGLSALISNAVEHGLYRIGRTTKSQLVERGEFQAELQRRASSVSGVVEATGVRKPDGVHYVIKDPGPGFAWRSQMGADPSTATSLGGRGVARAAVLFDGISYNNEGNIVATLMRFEKQDIW